MLALSGERLSPECAVEVHVRELLREYAVHQFIRRVRMRFMFPSKFWNASSEAFVKPTMSGVFSMPGHSFCVPICPSRIF